MQATRSDYRSFADYLAVVDEVDAVAAYIPSTRPTEWTPEQIAAIDRCDHALAAHRARLAEERRMEAERINREVAAMCTVSLRDRIIVMLLWGAILTVLGIMAGEFVTWVWRML